MADKKKIAELDKAIKDTREELAAIQQEKKAAADSPERLALIEKQERRKAEILATLERTKAAATYKPAEPTDYAEFLTVLTGYMDDKAEKVEKVAATIRDTEKGLQGIERDLQKAAADCDTEKTVELAEKQTELKSCLAHLHEMKARVDALPVFPNGAFSETWTAICEKVLPDWERQVLQVETLAAEYKAACGGLMAMHDTLKNLRREIQRIAEAEGLEAPTFAPVFTVGLAGKKLTLEKGDYIQLANLSSPLSGRAL